MIAARTGHMAVLKLLVETGANLSVLDNADNNILHIACMEGNLEIVKYLIPRKIIDIDSRGGRGTTPLMLAARFGKMEMFNFLLKTGANISKKDDDGENTLHKSCKGGNVDIVKDVITHRVLYVNSTDNNGITPLMLAAGYGSKVVFQLLIDRAADTSAKDDTDKTILHWACEGGNVEIVKDLLTQYTVDINSNDRKGMTPMLLAAYRGKSDVLGLLIKKGANALAVDHRKRNILHLSCTGGHVDTVRYVLNQTSVDINSKDHIETTPVLLAAYHGEIKVFDILVKNGADLTAVDECGDNILHCACRGGSVEITNRILMQNIVDINSKGDEGMTPVLMAASEGEREVFDFLVTQGADLLVTDEDGQTILHHACYGGNMEIVNYILIQNIVDINSKDDNGVTAVLVAASLGNREVFDFLVRQGADILVADDDGQNILHLACQKGNVEMVKYILTKKRLGINTKGSRGMPPVLQSVYYGKKEVFDVLVKQGADLSVVDKNGDSILHLACRRGNVEMVNDILTQKFVNINTKGYMGMPPVLLAVCFFNREVFDLLVKKGADLSVVDKHGDNILHLFCRYGNMKMVNYILTHTTLNINSTNNKKMTPLLMAAYHGKKDVLGLLLETGADTSAVDHKNNNVLHLSCTGGHVDTVKFILNLNIVDINSKDLSGVTPVMLAAYWRKREIFDILVQQGADLSISDRYGDNILHKACIGGDKEIAKHVLKLHIVDINSRGSKGMAALLYAAEYSDGDMFDLLLRNGADPSVVNNDGNNALHLACEEGANDIVESVLSQSIVNITAKNNKGLNAAEIARGNGHLSTAKLLS
ncbi:ankyrin-3-like [Haliotis asinina]|uniref:ankyrin-3-like n=1 Tax=Haliotis asinina TaxID=109174 RepID=UPI00353203C0